MLYCILHKKLQHGRGKVSFAFFQFEADVRDDPLRRGRTCIRYKYDSRNFYLISDGNQIPVRLVMMYRLHFRQVTQELAGKFGIFLYQFQQVVEVVEHEVRINLQLQRVELRL